MGQTKHSGARLAVIHARFEAIVRKMTNTLFRTARSGVINTGRDFSCCIVTAHNDLLVTAESLPIHVMSGPDLMAKIMRELSPDLKAGDAFLNNSPYHGNSHAGDHSLLVPVIDAGGTYRFTVVVKAHVADCGNSVPSTLYANATDVYNEGALIFPSVQVQRDYKDCEDIIRMCKMRIRAPEQWYGDQLGLVGAARVGERELLALGDELGWDSLDAFESQWLDYSELRIRGAIAKLPASTVTVANAHDPMPGLDEGIPIKAIVTVDPAEEIVTVDLTNNPDCVPFGLNLTEATATTAAMVGVFNSLGPGIPANAGSFRRINVKLRENCIAGIPRHPASCSTATTGVADRVTNAVQRAMAELGDGIGMAECGLAIPATAAFISGTDPRRDNNPYVNMITLGQTGGAGTPWSDGWLTIAHVGNGGLVMRDSTEIDELMYPIRIYTDRIIRDTAGPGRYRGAPAAEVEWGPTSNAMEGIWSSDGSTFPAQGARGGGSGATAKQFKRNLDGSLTPLDAFGGTKLQAGESVVGISSGGGGYGSPLERDPARVALDVSEGWVSVEQAKDVYGVVCDLDGNIDEPGTSALRAA
ncbi:MAG: hydantoinase B/oxoprolinase family protein [Sphingomonadaceae bacterium]|jgi:N-methylhydantoinase B|uniref:hydantoinase B/oxoprolinase family protein n=1 Tax=Sphingorhabdus sp. TaxID=1902408 RepID=UPI0039BC6DDF|nr:hydantoinase B/oxoprolinase family protein [Sphingomonadaceae bacterium]